jgi:hypothetical protein
MRVVMTKAFARWARGESISHKSLLTAVAEIESGLVDAHLGSGLVKKRIRRSGGGKSGGYRTIIAYRQSLVSVFLFGFAKNERDTLEKDELEYFRTLAADLLSKPVSDFDAMVADDRLVEVSSR